MGWTVYGDSYESTINSSITQPVIFNKEVILRAVRCWIILVDDPDFSTIKCRLWTDKDNSRGSSLADSTNELTKAEIITDNSGVKEIYFNFDDIALSASARYWITLDSDDANSMTSSSHIALRRQWPDPYYSGFTATFVNQSRAPFSFYFIGAEL